MIATVEYSPEQNVADMTLFPGVTMTVVMAQDTVWQGLRACGAAELMQRYVDAAQNVAFAVEYDNRTWVFTYRATDPGRGVALTIIPLHISDERAALIVTRIQQYAYLRGGIE